MNRVKRAIEQFRPATVIAILALFVAVGGTATAASGLINGKDIRKGTVATKQLKNKSISKAKLKPSTIKALKGSTGPAGVTGATGPAGAAGIDGIVAPLVAVGKSVLIPESKEKEVFQMDVPSGSYLVSYNTDLANQTSGPVSCVLAADGQTIDISEVSLDHDTRMNFTLMGVAPGNTNSLEVRCFNKESQFSFSFNSQMIATPIG